MAEMTPAALAPGNTAERVAGYDARDLSLSASLWTGTRRNTYLYRLDVTQPLSADTTVWPSVFKPGTPEASSRFGHQDSWASLDALRAATVEYFKAHDLIPFHTVAITLVLGDHSRNDDLDWSSIIPPTQPPSRAESWSFLGFDVCDAWLLSALMNYGFDSTKEDVTALRKTWGSRLNRFHLFTELPPAIDFKHASDRRLHRDHTPCFVFGLWLVK